MFKKFLVRIYIIVLICIMMALFLPSPLIYLFTGITFEDVSDKLLGKAEALHLKYLKKKGGV